MRRAFLYLWAAPVTLAALPAVAVALATGGRARWRGGVLEAAGGILGPLLRRGLPFFPISAITLGHVVLASGETELCESRAHERIHVRQYERWGFLFPLLYVVSSLAAAARGRGLYAGNAFERQAAREEVGSRFSDFKSGGSHRCSGRKSRRIPTPCDIVRGQRKADDGA